MLGLKRGTVELYEHNEKWDAVAKSTIERLWSVMGDVARDIQHVGSTSIKTVKAKPIIDIAVAVDDYDAVMALIPEMEKQGFVFRFDERPNQLLFVCGDFEADTRTHHIHIVLSGSVEWINYINFRDYLNAKPDIAAEYDRVKARLMLKFSNDRTAYTEGNSEFIGHTLRKALCWSYMGKTVSIKIDRPIGYLHQKAGYTLKYPINYGYIPGVIGGDGEELDVYLMGVDEPVGEYTARVIATVHREDDCEDKLVAAPKNAEFCKADIEKAVRFQEQYYKSWIEMID